MILKTLLAGTRFASPSAENPNNPVDDDGDFFARNGVRVTRDSSLAYSALWKGIGLIANYVGKLPCKINRRNGENWEVARDHPSYQLVHKRANYRMTANTFRKVLTKHAVLDGNGYAVILRENGRPAELWPLPPESTYQVTVAWDDAIKPQTEYLTTVGGRNYRLSPADVLHIRGLSDDGIEGLQMMKYGTDAIGLSLEAQQFGRAFFSNGIQLSGCLIFPRKLTEKAKENLRKSFESAHSGINKAFRLAVIQENGKLEQIDHDNEKAQFLQTREFQVRDVANFLMIPPHKLGDPTKQAYASLEQENQSFLDESLDPWLVEWENEYESKLLTTDQQTEEAYSVRFVRNAVVQIDMGSRFSAYNTALMGGWISPNEIRAREELNPRPGGDAYYMPLNMGLVGDDGLVVPVNETDSVEPNPEPTDFDGRARQAHRALIEWAVCRGFVRVTNAAKRFGRRPGDFLTWLDSGKIAEDNRQQIIDYLTPTLAASRAAGLTQSEPEPVADILLGKLRSDLLRLVETETSETLLGALGRYSEANQKRIPGEIAGSVIPNLGENPDDH